MITVPVRTTTPQYRLDFRELKARVAIEHVLADLGLRSRFIIRGDKLVGPCPLHRGDSNTAFVVSRTRNLWYCFTRCRCGGDVIDLVRHLRGSSYPDTARYLASLAGLPPPPTATPQPFLPFTATLHLDPGAPFLGQKQIHPDTARAFEAGSYHGRGFLQGCIAVRLHDPAGQPLGYAGRILDPEQALKQGKWRLPSRFPKNSILFNYHRAAAHLHQGAVLVEDPWSVMRLAQIGIPALALLGTTLSPAQTALLAPAARILLMLDGDHAGHLATHHLHQRLAHAHVASVWLPEGIDPDQLTDLELGTCCSLFLPASEPTTA
jgi:DNA primase